MNPQTETNNRQNQAEVEAERRAEDVSTVQVEDAAREQDVSTEQQDERAQTENVSTDERGDTDTRSDTSDTRSDTEHGLVRNERSAAFGRETEDTLDRLAKRGGASIEIVDRLTSGANAEYRNGAVCISAEALENDRAAALRDATMHELTHHIETSGEYEAFAGLVQRAVARESDVNAVLAEIVNDYAQEGIVLDEDGARRELVAKYAGEYLSSEENVRYLARETRGVFDRIREFLRDIVARFRGEDARTARELLKTFDRALESVGENEGNRYGETQNLIKRDADGKRFVEIEEDILDGVPRKEWTKTVKKMLSEKFPNGIQIGGRTIRVNQETRNEITRSDYSGGLYNDDILLLADKYNATNLLDELVQTSENWVGEKAKHKPQYEYARGEIRFRIADRDYIADLVARSKPRGTTMLYDITGITRTNFTQKETDTSNTAFLDEDRNSLASVSNDIVSERGQNGNSQSAQNRGENFGKQDSRGRTISEINAKLANMTAEERATLVRENEQMQKQVAELRQQLRRTPKGKKDARAVRRSTIEILRAYDSKADAGEISERLQKLYDRQGVGEFDAERYYEDFAEAMAIARDILSESETVNDELSRQYKDMKKHIRETAVTLSEQDRYDLSDDYNDFRRRYFGKIKLTNNGMGVDTLYGELQNDYGLLFFPDSITHPAEQLERIGEVLDSLAPTYENQYAGNLNDASKYVALQLMRQGAGMEAASPTFADRAAAKLGEARQETREARNELRELTRQYDADTAALDLRNERVMRALEAEHERRLKNEQRIKEHFKEVNEKRRERKHDRDARNKLLKLARRLDKMKTTPQNRAQIESLVDEYEDITGKITKEARAALSDAVREAYEQTLSLREDIQRQMADRQTM